MANPILVGIKRISDTLKGMYVRDENAVERCIYDTDGALYQGGTKVTATAAQLNGTSPTLTTATLTNPTITTGTATGTTLVDGNPTFSGNGAHHSWSSDHGDWTLSAAEATETYLQANGTADAGVNIIVPDTIKFYVVCNSGIGQTATVKTAAGAGIAVATAKSAILYCNGTNVQRVSADA